MKAILVAVSPGYNLGLAKLKNWLVEQGWQVEQTAGVRPLTDMAHLYAFSVIFSWHLPRLVAMVRQVPPQREVWIGGPGTASLSGWIQRETGVRPVVGPDWRFERQPAPKACPERSRRDGSYRWTRTTRGCPVGCAFCVVPRADGTRVLEYDDFPPAPVVVDDNILRASGEHQVRVVERLEAQRYPRVDFNSGFDPQVFTADHYDLYSRLPLKAWRLAFDQEGEAADVERMITLLRSRGVPRNKIRVYVLIGFDETPEQSLSRALRVIQWGGEPCIQAYRPLTWLDEHKPFVNAALGWTEELITALPRYFYGYYWRRGTSFWEFLDYTRERPFERARYHDVRYAQSRAAQPALPLNQFEEE